MQPDISQFKRIVVLTGAGVSAESGLSTFRDSNGLWENHRIEDVATPEAFERNPMLVWRFYSMRRQDAARVAPNAAHVALARFSAWAGDGTSGVKFTVVTQNVDMLHERASREAGAAMPLAMHGQLFRSRCVRCERIFEDETAWVTEASSKLPRSVCCDALSRPHIVWFGEMPLHIPEISAELEACDLFVSIGTSGQVYPAAGFIERAKIAGAATACLNKEPLPQRGMVDFYVEGPASRTVPQIFRRLSNAVSGPDTEVR
jgi:NAD-dependent deacetylase